MIIVCASIVRTIYGVTNQQRIGKNIYNKTWAGAATEIFPLDHNILTLARVKEHRKKRNAIKVIVYSTLNLSIDASIHSRKKHFGTSHKAGHLFRGIDSIRWFEIKNDCDFGLLFSMGDDHLFCHIEQHCWRTHRIQAPGIFSSNESKLRRCVFCSAEHEIRTNEERSS